MSKITINSRKPASGTQYLDIDKTVVVYKVVGEIRPSQYSYEARARELDGHFLLEQKHGQRSIPYRPFGIEHTIAEADSRLYLYAKSVAKCFHEEIVREFSPEVVDNSQRESK